MSQCLNRSKYWICPYFKWDGVKVIGCNAGKILFPTKEVCEVYIDSFCASYGWEKCTLAMMLNTYYEEKDG